MCFCFEPDHQERIQELAKPSSKLLPLVRDGLASSEPRLARAALGVLRAFALCEDVRDELSLPGAEGLKVEQKTTESYKAEREV